MPKTIDPNVRLHNLYCTQDQLSERAAIEMSDYELACRYQDQPMMDLAQERHQAAVRGLEEVARHIHVALCDAIAADETPDVYF